MGAAGWQALRALSATAAALPHPGEAPADATVARARALLVAHGAVVDHGAGPAPEPRLQAALDVLLLGGTRGGTTVGATVRGQRRLARACWATTGALAAAQVCSWQDGRLVVELRVGAVGELLADVLATLGITGSAPTPATAGAATTVLPIAALTPSGSVRAGVRPEDALLAGPPVVRVVVDGPAGTTGTTWLHDHHGPVRAVVTGDELRVQPWSEDRVHGWLLEVLTTQLDHASGTVAA